MNHSFSLITGDYARSGHGKYSDEYDESETDTVVIYDHEDFVKLYLDFVNLAMPDLEYEIVQEPSLNIGGYGLYY